MATPSSPVEQGVRPSTIHLPSLLAALLIMLAGTLYPPLMADATGKADHALASTLFLAMSAGFVRGVGFVPQHWVWRTLFSAHACAAMLAMALALKFLR